MSKMNWSGYWKDGTLYFPGEVVIFQGTAYIAREKTDAVPSNQSAYGWVVVARHEPHRIDHPWIPEEASYPLIDGVESDVIMLCRECWFTGNHVLAFKPDAHEYIIQEMSP